MNLIAKNKKAYFDYEIIKTYEAGIELKGYEVKSIRNKHINLKGSYVSCISGTLYAKSIHIGVLKNLSNKSSIDPLVERKIFLHKKEIYFLCNKIKESGFSIIPLELYFSGSLVKIRIGLVRGRKLFQKRQLLKERTLEKEAKMKLLKFI